MAPPGAPISRILDTICFYAVKDRANKIRLVTVSLDPETKAGFSVFYEIEGATHEQMRIPKYVFRPLVDFIMARSGMAMGLDREVQLGFFHPHLLEDDIFWPCRIAKVGKGLHIDFLLEDPLDPFRENDRNIPRIIHFLESDGQLTEVEWKRPGEEHLKMRPDESPSDDACDLPDSTTSDETDPPGD